MFLPDLVARLDACLPQTQCTRCGYPDCHAYAEALARGAADLNRCPPGGDVTRTALATILNRPPVPLDPVCGTHEGRARAVIDETHCIGCRKCLDVCPVDAIVGARQRLHTVLAADCNGCGLCAPPCPVDCIVFVPVTAPPNARPWPEYDRAETERWRVRAEARRTRLARRRASRPRRGSVFPPRETIRADIRAALERVRRKREGHRP
jgi:electron transport complex protein RnfB